MYEQAKGENAQEEKKRKKDEVEVSLFDAINTLIAHGHDKEKILKTYSKDEVSLFYEKCVKHDMRQKADFIEGVLAGIGGAFGGGKRVEKLLMDLRK